MHPQGKKRVLKKGQCINLSSACLHCCYLLRLLDNLYHMLLKETER